MKVKINSLYKFPQRCVSFFSNLYLAQKQCNIGSGILVQFHKSIIKSLLKSRQLILSMVGSVGNLLRAEVENVSGKVDEVKILHGEFIARCTFQIMHYAKSFTLNIQSNIISVTGRRRLYLGIFKNHITMCKEHFLIFFLFPLTLPLI